MDIIMVVFILYICAWIVQALAPWMALFITIYLCCVTRLCFVINFICSIFSSVFSEELPPGCIEGTQCFEEYLHHGLEPWINNHGTATPVLTVTLSANTFNMEVNESKMAIYFLSGFVLALSKYS